MRPCLIVLLTALLLSGCAEMANLRANDSIKQASASVPKQVLGQMSSAAFEQLTLGKPLTEEITASAQAYAFPEGTNYFKAFRLATAQNPTAVRLQTFVVGALHMPSAFVFYPHFTFLDSNYNVIARIEPKLMYANNFWNSEKSGWVAEVPSPANAAFLFVHAPTAKIGSRLYYKEGVTQASASMVLAGKTPVFLSGNWWDVYLPASNAGRFEIEQRSSI